MIVAASVFHHSLSISIFFGLCGFSSYEILLSGNVKEKESPNDNEGLVLLDARNLYETRIGKFHTPGVETLDPEIRQYSDLTTWIDSNSDRLQGKQILMSVFS